MNFKVYFSMSTGLSESITVEKGTLARIRGRVSETEEILGLAVQQYKDNPPHWEGTQPRNEVSDEVYCQVAEAHNGFMRWLHCHLEKHADSPFPGGEVITPEQLARYWHGLREIDVPVQRWSRDYYVCRMEEAYESLRGRGEAFTADSDPLTERQAADVICLFSQWLDAHDCRPDVPVGCDHLACSDDGGYCWCERCGPVTEMHVSICTETECPAREMEEDGDCGGGSSQRTPAPGVREAER